MSTHVVEELAVRLTLDSADYERGERDLDRTTDRTERNANERVRRFDRRNGDQQRQLRNFTAGLRSFAGAVQKAAVIATGLGLSLGVAIAGIVNFETGLRRQSVGTAMSNKEMQAWGATARRLGADADAGAEAIANFERERKQFNVSGNGPTLNALSMIGVNVNPDRAQVDIIESTQEVFRNATDVQRQQYESMLLVQGVSSDLILMFKSEINVREALSKSLSQSVEENRAALDKAADTLESFKAATIQVGAVLLETLSPELDSAAQFVAKLSTEFAKFTQDVRAAGGGVNGFQAALDNNLPALGDSFSTLRTLVDGLSDVTHVITNRFRETGASLGILWGHTKEGLNTLRNKEGVGFGDALVDDARNMWSKITDDWRSLVAHSRVANGSWPENLDNRTPAWPRNIENGRPFPRNIENDWPRNIENGAKAWPENVENARGTRSRVSSQWIMNRLITRHGASVQDAAAIAANIHRESGGRPDAYNSAGGGIGARGLVQLRGARARAFKARYGVLPNEGTAEQQLEFMYADQYERNLLTRSLAAGGSAASKGVGVSKIYEAHGNVAEDMRRGRDAQRLHDDYARNSAGGNSINIQNVNVNANDSQSFVGSLQRLDGSQGYNTVIR